MTNVTRFATSTIAYLNGPKLPGTIDIAQSVDCAVEMAEISPAELSEQLESDDAPYVLDIRPAEAFEEWHVPGSENIDVYEELKNDPAKADEALDAVPADEEIVTVCAAGVLSAEATDRLNQLGYDAKTLVDGMAGWSRVHRSAPVDLDITGTLVQVVRPGKGCLSHVLIADEEAAVVDPSQYAEEYEAILSDYGAELVAVFDTHAHADHVSGGQKLARRNDAVYHIHPEDAEDLPAEPIEHGQSVEIGTVEIQVLHTPGHSPGAVTYAIEDEALLTGDTLFHESVGRVELGLKAGIEETDVADNAATLFESLERLVSYAENPLVLPAHHPGSPEAPVTATLSEVRDRNTDLGRSRDAFVAALSSDVPKHPPNFQRVKRVNVGSEDVPAEELAELELGPNRCAAE